MSHFRYTAACKIAAVRRVVEDGRSVCEVAREAGVSEGSLFFWVRRYRQFAQDARGGGRSLRIRVGGQAGDEPLREAGSLVAHLRRAGIR